MKYEHFSPKAPGNIFKNEKSDDNFYLFVHRPLAIYKH